ncbi:unnamed protein product [Rhizopus microsporus]
MIVCPPLASITAWYLEAYLQQASLPVQVEISSTHREGHPRAALHCVFGVFSYEHAA